MIASRDGIEMDFMNLPSRNYNGLYQLFRPGGGKTELAV
jgi:hypothetical protein